MIEKLIYEIIKKRFNIPVFECEVVSVDKVKDTCVLKPLEEDRAQLKNVRLTASVETKTTKIVVYPKPNSTVVVALLNDIKTDALIISYSEVDEINIDCEAVTFNKGLLGGLISIDSFLVELNARITGLKTATAAGFTAQAAIDGGLGGSAFTTGSAAVTPIVKAGFEDTKIKH